MGKSSDKLRSASQLLRSVDRTAPGYPLPLSKSSNVLGRLSSRRLRSAYKSLTSASCRSLTSTTANSLMPVAKPIASRQRGVGSSYREGRSRPKREEKEPSSDEELKKSKPNENGRRDRGQAIASDPP